MKQPPMGHHTRLPKGKGKKCILSSLLHSGNNELRKEKSHSWRAVYIPGTWLVSYAISLMARNTCSSWLPPGGLSEKVKAQPRMYSVICGPEAKASLSEFNAPALPLTPSGGVHDSKSTSRLDYWYLQSSESQKLGSLSLLLFFVCFFLFFINLFTLFIFIFGCIGSSLLHAGPLQLQRAGATPH